MKTPTTGQISFSALNLAAGVSPTATIALNDASIRTLMGAGGSGLTTSMSTAYNKGANASDTTYTINAVFSSIAPQFDHNAGAGGTANVYFNTTADAQAVLASWSATKVYSAVDGSGNLMSFFSSTSPTISGQMLTWSGGTVFGSFLASGQLTGTFSIITQSSGSGSTAVTYSMSGPPGYGGIQGTMVADFYLTTSAAVTAIIAGWTSSKIYTWTDWSGNSWTLTSTSAPVNNGMSGGGYDMHFTNNATLTQTSFSGGGTPNTFTDPGSGSSGGSSAVTYTFPSGQTAGYGITNPTSNADFPLPSSANVNTVIAAWSATKVYTWTNYQGYPFTIQSTGAPINAGQLGTGFDLRFMGNATIIQTGYTIGTPNTFTDPGSGSSSTAAVTYTSSDIATADAGGTSNADIQFLSASSAKVDTIIANWKSTKVYVVVTGGGMKYNIQSTSAPTKVTTSPWATPPNVDLHFESTNGTTLTFIGSGFPGFTFTDPGG
jgi:hypothetical protein